MRLSSLSVRKPIATAMVFSALALLGLVAFSRTGVDLLPNIAVPRLLISTVFRDATPEEVETLVTEPLEAAVAGVQGVKKVRSVSREGVSIITLDFVWGTPMDATLLTLREKLDNARFFLPREAGRPTITRLDPAAQPILTLALSYADTAASALRFVHRRSDSADVERLIALKEAGRLIFKRRLEQIEGVAQAALTGGLEREIIVDLDATKLAKYGVTLDEAVEALKASNMSIPAGAILQGLFKYSLRALGEFASVADAEQTVIRRSSDEGVILLGDIARARSSCKDRLGLTRLDGAEAVGVHIYKDPAANTVDIAARVREAQKTLAKEYPDFRLAVIADDSRFIEAAISNVQQEILYGGCLAVLVLFVFLRSPRNIFIIGVTIPVALITTALLMYLFGVSFNIISLGGVAVGVGLLLDGSIVVIESIARKREEGLPPRLAALRGVREVGMPIAAGTITTMAVFVPLIFLKGVAGELFKDQSYTVVFSLGASLLAALTLIPMLASRERSRPVGNGAEGGVWNRLTRLIAPITTPVFDLSERGVARSMRWYDAALERALDRPVLTLCGVGVLAALAALATLAMTKEFIPPSEQEEFTLEIEFPAGTSLAASAKALEPIEQALLALPEVEHCVADIGVVNELSLISETRPVAAPARILVKLRSIEDSPRTQEAAVALLRSFPDIRFRARLRENAFAQIIQPAESDIVIRVQNRDVNLAFQEASALAQEIRQSPLFSSAPAAAEKAPLRSVAVAADKAEPEYRIVVNREQCLRYGVQAGAVARAIAETTKGKVATSIAEFDNKIDIRVQPVVAELSFRANRKTDGNADGNNDENNDTEEFSIGIEDLFRQYIQLPGASGGKSGAVSLPISALASWERAEAFREIRREDGLRTIYAFASLHPEASLEKAVAGIERIAERRPRAVQGRTVVGGANEEIREAFSTLYAALAISALLMYTVLAVEFESLLFPFIILFSLPLGLIGAMITLYLAGASLNIVSLMGLVILIGIADNDAVVKVETILAKRAAGLPLREAIIAAGQERFRPIVMNSLTVIFGLVPMMLGSGAATQLRTSLSLAVIGGLISATALTLIVIPILYTFAERLRGTAVSRASTAEESSTAEEERKANAEE